MNLLWDWVSKTTELNLQNKKFAIATIINAKGSTPREIGAKMIVVNKQEFYGTIGGGALEAKVMKEIFRILDETHLNHPTIRLEFDLKDLGMICGGDTEVLIEILNSNPDLYLFGAGHCGLALSNVLQGIPFNIHVIDDRQDWLDKYPANVNTHNEHWQKFIENAHWNKDTTYVVIMTSGHCDDRDILEQVIKKPTKYLGMIGSHSKWAITKSKLIETGSDKNRLDEVHCPIGLNIGGKTPAEIAVSIAAELIQQNHSNS